MSGIRPLFVSAPRCKISLNGAVLAYAIGINVNVRVDVQNLFVMGQYDSLTTEPLMYGLVSGTIQIVKLNSAAELATRAAAAAGLSPLQQTSSSAALAGASGSSVHAVPPTNTANTNSALGLPGLSLHLNPALVLASETFDLDIMINHLSTTKATETPVSTLSTLFSIKNCRFTGSNINIALGSLVNEPLTFQGLFALNYNGSDPSAQVANQQSDNSVVDGAV